jgi:hypothetical protein
VAEWSRLRTHNSDVVGSRPGATVIFYLYILTCTVLAHPLLCLITFHAQICSLCVRDKEAVSLIGKRGCHPLKKNYNNSVLIFNKTWIILLYNSPRKVFSRKWWTFVKANNGRGLKLTVLTLCMREK